MSDHDNMYADSRRTSQTGTTHTYASLRTGLATLAGGVCVAPGVDRARAATRQLFSEGAGAGPAPVATEESLTGVEIVHTPSPGIVPPGPSYRRVMDDARANLLATQNLLAERGIDLAAARARIAALENALDQRRAREEGEIVAREAQARADAERAREAAEQHARELAEQVARLAAEQQHVREAAERAHQAEAAARRAAAEQAARLIAEQQRAREQAVRLAAEQARELAAREVARVAAEQHAREAIVQPPATDEQKARFVL